MSGYLEDSFLQRDLFRTVLWQRSPISKDEHYTNANAVFFLKTFVLQTEMYSVLMCQIIRLVSKVQWKKFDGATLCFADRLADCWLKYQTSV